jgi:hypothetical protein
VPPIVQNKDITLCFPSGSSDQARIETAHAGDDTTQAADFPNDCPFVGTKGMINAVLITDPRAVFAWL